MGEKLKWIMDALNLSGKDLADYLGVDYSTMSKWRNGVRTLKYRSRYLNEMAAYFLSCPGEQEGHILRDLLEKQYPGLNASDGSQLRNALCLWLTVPQTPPSGALVDKRDLSGIFSVQVDASLGMRNMFQEQKRFFRLLRDMEPGQTVTVTDFGAVDWSSVDLSLVEETVAAVVEALRCGHRMRIIDQITGLYRPWFYMFRFLPLYLSENVTAYFYRDPQPSPLRHNMFLAEGKMALTVVSTPAKPELVVNSFYRESENVRLYDALADTILAGSQLMIHTMPVGQIHSLLDIIDSHMKSSRLLYMMNRIPTFRNMTAELLGEILADNGVTGELLELCLEANRKSTSTRGRCQSRQIYDLDAVEAAAEQESLVEHDLSAITGRNIRIYRRQFLRQLEHLRENIRAENYSLVLFPFSQLKMDPPPPFNIIVQDDSLSAAWDAEKYSRRMYSEDLSIVNGFYQYADSVWEHIPPVSKTEEWCRRQIDRILADIVL